MDRNHLKVKIDKNSFSDEGDGIILFPDGLSITDNSLQRNGTRYDVDTLNLEEFSGTVTADHVDKLDAVIGKVDNTRKVGNRVIVDSIKFAVKENPLARLAYNLFKGNYLSDFSIETYGPQPDEEGIYYNSSLIGLSAVVVGNNRNAHITKLVHNSIKEAQDDGLETDNLESIFNSSEEKTLNNKEKDNMSKDEEVAIETPVVEETEVKVDNKVEEKTESFSLADVTNAIKEAVSPMQETIAKLEQNAFDKGVEEPKFKKSELTIVQDNGFSALDWRERHGKQINAAWDLLKRQDYRAADVLNEINELNLADLKKDGVVSNSLTIADFGNFVISRELLTEIEGCRNDYTALIKATSWKETLSTQFAWLARSGDISMTAVDMCDSDDGNLKPISEYTANIKTSDLEELAAVTPVCNAATRFLAVDLLGDVAAGYRNDYDRKRAQLIIARLEQAVEDNGNSIVYDTTHDIDTLTHWAEVWNEIANCTPNGTFIFNTSTYAEVMKRAVASGVNGPLGSIFITGQVPTIFGRPFIVVSNDLMPTLDVAATVSIAVDGSTTTVNHAVFYANLDNFTGRTSGGLMYDLSTEAAYETSARTVQSAFQRNELVLRGSFFRGGAIKDTDQVAGMLSPGVS